MRMRWDRLHLLASSFDICFEHPGDKTVLRTHAGSRKPAKDISDIKACGSIARKEFEIIFKKNIPSEQTARKLKLHPVEEPTVTCEKLCPSVAGKIVRESNSRSDFVAPAKFIALGKSLNEGRFSFSNRTPRFKVNRLVG